ncbi:Matrix metalloproteinase-17 [Larimichthys crocea]|uniref:Matrix metalloproteinase-17 n=1 Tax=Larimichthys crocea TaxID=215358 RepID=A0A6G0I0S1_LARCR|nr:Matrix metalloproteinase-17 [Larimichthys crocea]
MISRVVHKWMRNISPEMLLLVPMLWFLPLTGAAPSVTTEQLDTGVDWLSKFGYLPPPDPVTGQLQTKEALTKAIKAMQKFGGLEETGVFDQATLGLMKTPRCSLPDVSEADATMGRRKRSLTPQNKWNKRHLSWRVRTFPKDSALLGRDTVRALMYYALKVWSDIAPLNFHEVAGSDADIQIDFTKADHNDGYPFDGPGGTVAHAFFPGERFTAGDTHFDDDEAWTFRSPDSHGMDLFAVAVHEFGHAIGLVHTSAIESIMRPYYQGPVGDPLKYDLPYEDKVRVWQLYGWREMPPTDALVTLMQWPRYEGRPSFSKIHRFWRGLPTNLDSVDAVYERPGDHKIVFFKGLKYWVFKDNIVEEGYPRPISDFGLPSDGVDAAFVWLHNDKTYFFKDNSYWRYDDHLRRMDLGYPKDSTLWKGLPSQLDDAMRWSDGSSYFFKGKEYWRVPGSDMEVEAGYPRLIAKDWLLCTEMQSDSPDTEPKSTETRGNAHHHPDHAENGYEVCSCTSDSASPLGARPSPSPMWLLPPLWTLSLALRSELL